MCTLALHRTLACPERVAVSGWEVCPKHTRCYKMEASSKAANAGAACEGRRGQEGQELSASQPEGAGDPSACEGHCAAVNRDWKEAAGQEVRRRGSLPGKD